MPLHPHIRLAWSAICSTARARRDGQQSGQSDRGSRGRKTCRVAHGGRLGDAALTNREPRCCVLRQAMALPCSMVCCRGAPPVPSGTWVPCPSLHGAQSAPAACSMPAPPRHPPPPGCCRRHTKVRVYVAAMNGDGAGAGAGGQSPAGSGGPPRKAFVGSGLMMHASAPMPPAPTLPAAPGPSSSPAAPGATATLPAGGRAALLLPAQAADAAAWGAASDGAACNACRQRAAPPSPAPAAKRLQCTVSGRAARTCTCTGCDGRA